MFLGKPGGAGLQNSWGKGTEIYSRDRPNWAIDPQGVKGLSLEIR